MTRSYSELEKLETFEERYEYLRLQGVVGESTFGFDRWLNQQLYRSSRWKDVRERAIIRDSGCDLGIPGYAIYDRLVVHHMNPITKEDVALGRDIIFNLDVLICTSFRTHQAIHYGDESLLPKTPVVRRPGDTTLWA